MTTRPRSATLEADFTLQYRGGPTIECAWAHTFGDARATVRLGPSGCGKTTVLRVLAGLERPQRGHIRHGARAWFDSATGLFLAPERRDIGFLFQDYALFPHMTVAGNITFAARGMPQDKVAARLGELVDVFGLRGLETRRPRELSGGQQQRVALARAVFRRPALLLLDEPLSALDATMREEVRNELRVLIEALDIPTYIVTHDRADALSLGDRTMLMEGGRIIQSGSTREVFGTPTSPTAARLVGVDTVLIGTIARVEHGLATVVIEGREIRAEALLPAGHEVALCIRAEDVTVARAATEDSSARNRWKGIVAYETIEGPFVRVMLDCGFRLSALITRDAWEGLSLRPGDEAMAVVKAASIRVLPRH